MSKSRQRIPPALLFILITVGLLFIAASFVTIYRNLTDGSADLVPRWKGAELYFKEGINPYSERVGLESQQMIYGRPARADEDQVLFAYPFFTVFYIGPLAFLDYQLAAAITMQILLLGLLLALALSLHLLRWLPSPPLLAAIVLFTLVAYFSVRGILLAQLAIVGYVGHILALWAAFRGRDSLTGVGLALSTIKPQTGYLILPLLLLWAVRRRRWPVITSFSVTFGLLMGLSFLLEPSWLADWLTQVQAYQGYTETIATAEIVTHFVDGIPAWLENAAQILLTIGLAFPVIIGWKRILIDGQNDELLWVYFLTMTLSLLIAPRTATTYYVELYPVLLVTTMILARQRRQWVIYGGGLVLLIGYWVLHIATVPPSETGGLEAPVVYVIFPVIIWAMLFIYRQQWPTFDMLDVSPERS